MNYLRAFLLGLLLFSTGCTTRYYSVRWNEFRVGILDDYLVYDDKTRSYYSETSTTGVSVRWAPDIPYVDMYLRKIGF